MAVVRKVRQARPAGFGGLCAAPQEQGRIGPRMPAEKASEFEAGIAGRSENGGFEFG
jgi:hypothetical protein